MELILDIKYAFFIPSSPTFFYRSLDIYLTTIARPPTQ